MMMLRSTEYTQMLFLIFSTLVIVVMNDGFRNYLQIGWCSVAAALMFFIKINYGIAAFFVMAIVGLVTLVANRKAFVVLLLPYAITFSAICVIYKVSPGNYCIYGLELIKGYNEAMFLGLPASHPAVVASFVELVIFLILLSVGLKSSLWETSQRSIIKALPAVLIVLMLYALFYKNGFTRTDYLHFGNFFLTIPILAILMTFLFRIKNTLAIPCVLALMIISMYTIAANKPGGKMKIAKTETYYLVPFYHSLYTRHAKKYDEGNDSVIAKFRLSAADLSAIGSATVDIFPVEILLPVFNDLHYSPRPVPQSYTVYTHALDSLNGAFFSGPRKPAYVIIKNTAINNRYPVWDESLTKAALHFNYVFEKYLTFSNYTDTTEKFNPPYMLLKAGPVHAYPRFVALNKMEARLGERIPVSYPDSIPLYFSADIKSSLSSKLLELIYQPPSFTVTLYLNDGTTEKFAAKLPVMRQPCLINKLILTNDDLKNYLSGNLKANKTITAFSLAPDNKNATTGASVTFWKLDNY